MDNDAVAHGGEAWYVPTRLIITTGDTPSFSSQKKKKIVWMTSFIAPKLRVLVLRVP